MASVVVAVNESDGGKKVEKNHKTDNQRVELEQTVNCNEFYSLFWKAKIITVEPVAFLYTFGMSFTVAFSFQYFFQRYARDKLPQSAVQHHFCITDDYLNHTVGKGAVDEAEDHAAHLTFLVALANLLMSVVSTIFIGPLTDRFGRRVAIASSNLGGVLSSLSVIIIVYMEMNLYYIIASNLITAFFGGFGVLFAGSFSYIADISSHQTRSLRIGILELMVYISSALTSVFVGIWLSEVNCNFTSLTWPPFLCYVTSLLYSLFLLPESLSKAQRQEKTNDNKLETLWKGILLYFRPKLVTLKLWICLGVLLIVIVNITGAITINTYFYIRRPLKWSPDQIGLYGGFSAVTHGMALLLLMPIALTIGVPDVVLAIVGVISSCIGYLFIAGVKKTWQMYAISSFQGIEAVIVPAVRSMMSKYISKDEQGALFAVVASVEVSAALIGSSIYTNLYPTLHQLSYFLMSVLAMIPIIPLCLILIMEICAKRAAANRGIKDKEQQLSNSVSCADDDDERSSLLSS